MQSVTALAQPPSVGAPGARQPRPYQHAAIDWLWAKKRAFLTDGFGLGKTTEAIMAAETPCLVVAPVHLLAHWRREILACKPDARVLVGGGTSLAARKTQLVGDADFYVVNTEMLRTGMQDWLAPLRAGAIRTLIVDEAHRLRGRTSQQSRGALTIATHVPRVYLLTATPVYNQPNDLYSQLRLLDPVRFGSYWSFMRDYLSVMQTPWGPKILGLKHGKKLLEVFREYAFGRTREEVQAQLPALQEMLFEAVPPDSWYKQYEALKRTYRAKDGSLLLSKQGILQRLRSATQHAKLQAVCMLIQDNDCAADTLIYTYHKDLAYSVGHLLKAPVITGDMPPAHRESVARGHNFVVATFPSVAEGLDFSHMRNIVFMEHDYQAGMIDQALNRVHRPGNLHTSTMVYHVVVPRSVDSVIYKVMKKRGTTLEEVVEAALVPMGENGEINEIV